MIQPRYRTVAILPMKANSERVPGKNFRVFAGKPLFQWVLDTLLSLETIEAVVINTDARSLLSRHGLVGSDRVLIRDRPEELLGDEVSMNLIIENDINAIDAKTYVMTHTTNPLLSASTISRALSAYVRSVAKGSSDSLFSVSRFQTRFYRGDGTPVNHDPKNLLRTQDLEPWYEENSNLYVFSRESFESTNSRIGANPLLFETSRSESFDIDDQEGWDLAEIVAEYLQLQRSAVSSAKKGQV